MSYPVPVTGLVGLCLNFDCCSLIFFLAYKEQTGDMNIAFQAVMLMVDFSELVLVPISVSIINL